MTQNRAEHEAKQTHSPAEVRKARRAARRKAFDEAITQIYVDLADSANERAAKHSRRIGRLQGIAWSTSIEIGAIVNVYGAEGSGDLSESLTRQLTEIRRKLESVLTEDTEGSGE